MFPKKKKWLVAVAPNGKVKDLESKRNERGRELRGKGKKKLGEERRCMQATAVGLPSHSGPGGSLRRASYRSAAVAVRDAGIADLI